MITRDRARWFVLLAVLIVLTAACGSETVARNRGEHGTGVVKTKLMISAAASLHDALSEVEAIYEKQHPDIDLLINYAGSGSLAKQIEQGAPIDLFISASTSHIQRLIALELMDAEMQAVLFSNELVIAVHIDSAVELDDIADLTRDEVKRIAVGIPVSVPAGSYAKEALENAGVWEELQDKLVQGKDVRQVLHYVETGNADAGLVYQTDVMASARLRTALKVDSQSYTPVEYTAGIVTSAINIDEAAAFYRFLRTEESLSVFGRYGFAVSP